MWFVDDLRSRVANRVQLTSDGHKAYLEAVEGAFGADIDYAQLVKIYVSSPESSKGRYSPAECTVARKEKPRRIGNAARTKNPFKTPEMLLPPNKD